MHGVAFNVDLYMGNTGKTDGVLYGKLPANATAAQTPDNAYIGNVYRAVNAAADRERQADPADHLAAGAASPTPRTTTPTTRPRASPASFGLNAVVALPGHAGGRRRRRRQHVALAQRRDRRRARPARSSSSPPATAATTTRRRAAPRRTTCPSSRAAGTRRRASTRRTGARFNPDGSVLVPGTQTFNRCGVAKWSCVTAPGQQHQQHHGAGRQRRAAAALRRAPRAPRWPARTRRPCSRWSCSASRT